MAAKKPITASVAKTAKLKTTATPATDAAPQGELSSTTKSRGTTVPPKKGRSAAGGLAAPTATDIPSPMTTGVAAEITDAQIREHAYHLWLSGAPGDQDHHWHTAAKALRNRKS